MKEIDNGVTTKKILKIARKEIIIRVISNIIYRASVMLIPIFLSIAVNNISNNNYNGAIRISIVAIFTVIIYRLFDIITTYTWHKMYNKMFNSYTEIGVKKTFNNSMFSLSRISMGEYLNIMNNDINVICAFYCDLTIRIIRIFEISIIFIYFFMINLYIGLVGLIVSVVSLLIIFFARKKIENVNKIKAINYDKRSGILNEFLLSIKEIKGLNIFKLMFTRTNESTKKYSYAFLVQRLWEDIFKFSMLLFIELCRWGLFIYGIYLISNGSMELGTLLIIYNYYAQLIDGFSEFATINNGLRQLKVSENRFNKLVEYSYNINKKRSIKNEEINGSVEFINVLHGFKNNPVLNNISFKIRPNSITCIAGNAGSGKTGIVDLLLKLNRQHEGEILIDGIDIKSFDNDEYYNLIASVSKTPMFLNMSIKENFKVALNNFEQVIKMCNSLEIHDDIIKLKHGYDTVLNGPDDTLNPTVKSLLAIARILLKSPKIMIFDEIFNNLDKNIDYNIIRLLDQIKNNHTIIIITKEKHILEKSDEVIVIDNGEFILKGKHNELKNNNELYKELINK